ncbi:hypothetical protein ILUMI_04453 [Ignelater luminosus]|uniref:RING finger protein 141 n=1 Tax=Ignelater luminosus TaxID=2038154 RepID=A0A8K0GEJ2_IGNLU|nr:hypothetical protein ILUMI_04453 [Ignelater luminosus]
MGHNASSQFHEFVTPFVSQLLNDESTANTLISSEINSMTYEEFTKTLGELNLLSKKCLDSSGNQLVFAVKKGTDSTVFWKATVQVACVKINSETKKVETYRLLNLNEFLRVFKTLKCQYSAVQQSKRCSKDTEATKYLTTSTFFNHLDDVTKGGYYNGDQSECCICLERQPEVSLPCTHSYCLPCIEEWNESHDTCPICREKLESTEDTWVLSEVPKAEDITEEIRSDLMNLAVERSHPCSPS